MASFKADMLFVLPVLVLLVILILIMLFMCWTSNSSHIVPVARLEAFRALKLSRLESFRALQSICQIGGF